MKRRKSKKLEKTWTHKLSVLAISFFSIIFIINMADLDKQKQLDNQVDTVEIDQLVLDSYIGLNQTFKDTATGTDPIPLEVSFRANRGEDTFRVVLSCEHYIFWNSTPMVRVYKENFGQHLDSVLKSPAKELNFADEKICNYWLNKLHSEIESQQRASGGSVLNKKYRVKYDKSSGLILDVAEQSVRKAKAN